MTARILLGVAALFAARALPGIAPHAASPRQVTSARLERLAADIRANAGATLPSSADGADALASDPSELVDAWGNEIVYIRTANGFWLVSWGADGAPGGEGDAADVVYISG